MPVDMQSFVQSLIVLQILCCQPLTKGVLLPHDFNSCLSKVACYYRSVNHWALAKYNWEDYLCDSQESSRNTIINLHLVRITIVR